LLCFLAETLAALFVLANDGQRPLPTSTAAWLLLTGRHLVIDS
jgi:hypothetical protein